MNTILNGAPAILAQPTAEEQAQQMLDDVAARVAQDLGLAISNLGFPVGMGLSPPPEMLLIAATKIANRFSGAVLKAIEHETCASRPQWQPIAHHDGGEFICDLWFEATGREHHCRWFAADRFFGREEWQGTGDSRFKSRRRFLARPTHFMIVPPPIGMAQPQ